MVLPSNFLEVLLSKVIAFVSSIFLYFTNIHGYERKLIPKKMKWKEFKEEEEKKKKYRTNLIWI